MTPAQLAQVRQQEQKAIDVLAQRFPKQVSTFLYKDLLIETFNNTCLEAQLVQYADKLDALCEALHEIFGGNTVFTINVKNQYGTIPLPFEAYSVYFNNFLNKYPKLKLLFETDLPFPLIPPTIDYTTICQTHQPHTKNSITNPTGHPHYDFWKTVILKNPDIIAPDYLYTQVEKPTPQVLRR